MPSYRKLPNIILSDTGGRSAQHKRTAKARRFTKVSGRRGGFPHPVPSSVPTGSLETKSQKFANIEYDLLAAGTVTHVNNISQGTGNADRLGYKMRGTGLHLKGQFHCPSDGPNVAVCGYCLVWDKTPSKALATPSDIFNINAGAGYDMSNTFPVDNDRFVILKSYRRSIARAPWQMMGNCLVDDFIKLPKYCVTGFVKGNPSGGIANTQTGALLLIPYRSVLDSGTQDTVKLNLTSEFFFAEA